MVWADIGDSKFDRYLRPLVPFLHNPHGDSFEFYPHFPVNFYTSFHCALVPTEVPASATEITRLQIY